VTESQLSDVLNKRKEEFRAGYKDSSEYHFEPRITESSRNGRALSFSEKAKTGVAVGRNH
jgi:hypothetical protein